MHKLASIYTVFAKYIMFVTLVLSGKHKKQLNDLMGVLRFAVQCF